MAAGDRSKKLRGKVQQLVGDPSGIGIAHQGAVYDALNRIQLRIAEEASADQKTETVSIVANTELYALPDGFIAAMAIRGGDTTPLEKVRNIQEVSEIKRKGSSTSSNEVNPVYWYLWDDQIGFMTAAGGAPTGASTVTLYTVRMPKGDGTEDIGDTVDPLVHRRWDDVFIYGAAFYLTTNEKFLLLYENEFRRVKNFENIYRGNTYQIPNNREYD